jgi:hypothetical protein
MNLPAAESVGYLREVFKMSVIPRIKSGAGSAKAGIQRIPEKTGFPLEFIPHSDAGRE